MRAEKNIALHAVQFIAGANLPNVRPSFAIHEAIHELVTVCALVCLECGFDVFTFHIFEVVWLELRVTAAPLF